MKSKDAPYLLEDEPSLIRTSASVQISRSTRGMMGCSVASGNFMLPGDFQWIPAYLGSVCSSSQHAFAFGGASPLVAYLEIHHTVSWRSSDHHRYRQRAPAVPGPTHPTSSVTTDSNTVVSETYGTLRSHRRRGDRCGVRVVDRRALRNISITGLGTVEQALLEKEQTSSSLSERKIVASVLGSRERRSC